MKNNRKAVLASREWGRDDYSLNVASLPMARPDEPAADASSSAGTAARARRIPAQGQGRLFDVEPA